MTDEKKRLEKSEVKIGTVEKEGREARRVRREEGRGASRRERKKVEGERPEVDKKER